MTRLQSVTRLQSLPNSENSRGPGGFRTRVPWVNNACWPWVRCVCCRDRPEHPLCPSTRTNLSHADVVSVEGVAPLTPPDSCFMVLTLLSRLLAACYKPENPEFRHVQSITGLNRAQGDLTCPAGPGEFPELGRDYIRVTGL